MQSQPERDVSPTTKVLIPTVIIAITILIPWWYWSSQNYYDSQCRRESASNIATFGTAPPGSRNPCPKASYAKQKAYETPWYDWALIGITAIYTLFAIFQWKAISQQADIAREQAKTTERQLAVQEAAFAQWVDFEDWVTNCDESGEINLFFSLINRTNFPLTLQRLNSTLCGVSQSSFPKCKLLPSQEFHTFVSGQLTEEEKSRYQSTAVILKLEGTISFMDVLGTEEVQKFGFLVTCNKRITNANTLWGTAYQETGSKNQT